MKVTKIANRYRLSNEYLRHSRPLKNGFEKVFENVFGESYSKLNHDMFTSFVYAGKCLGTRG